MADNEKELRWASSEDFENWHAEDLSELLDYMDGDEVVEPGRVVYVGEVQRLNKMRFLPDAESIIETIGEQAYDDGGEYGEDYPSIDKAGKDALNAALREWAEKHLPEPTFYLIENVKPYTITADDLKEPQA